MNAEQEKIFSKWWDGFASRGYEAPVPLIDEQHLREMVESIVAASTPPPGGNMTQQEALERFETLIHLILPMARGYAHLHPVGSNEAYIREVDDFLADYVSAGPLSPPPPSDAKPEQSVDVEREAEAWAEDYRLKNGSSLAKDHSHIACLKSAYLAGASRRVVTDEELYALIDKLRESGWTRITDVAFAVRDACGGALRLPGEKKAVSDIPVVRAEANGWNDCLARVREMNGGGK